MGEFELIEAVFAKAFAPLSQRSAQVALGIGDDCALLTPAAGQELAISTDMMVEGRHFLSTVPPDALGHKALAVNLSDLAACGATPMGFLLSLSLPHAGDAAWLHAFAGGLLALATEHACPLVGGNTTRGPLAIGITVLGQVPSGQALLRSGAQVGDAVYVSGHPGRARAALEVFRGNLHASAAQFKQWRMAMERPTPRVALGQALRGVASSAVDVSDGLVGDAQHILRASAAKLGRSSALGLELQADAFTPFLIATEDRKTATPSEKVAKNTPWAAAELALAGGDDYELLFTAPPTLHAAVLAAARASATPVRRIGHITAKTGLRWVDTTGKAHALKADSFDHFA